MQLRDRIKELRRVPGFQEYAIDEHGNIFRAEPSRGTSVGKQLKSTIGKDGYVRVVLWARNKPAAKTVHSLVAAAFISPRPPNLEVNHIDGNKKNNHVSNLEYVSRSENLLHRSSKFGIGRGENNHRCKITKEVVLQIRELHSKGFGYKRLSRHFNLSWGLIRSVVTRKTWSHVN